MGAISSVWRAYYEFQTALKGYDYAKALLAASNESYAANIDTYHQGLSTIVELLTADRDLASARYTMVQSCADLLTSSAGGGIRGRGDRNATPSVIESRRVGNRLQCIQFAARKMEASANCGSRRMQDFSNMQSNISRIAN
ncbi:MAG: TolC family protein [Candidatus Binatus sp.]|uniref:TolC family protein n=1 Tax=Candidatus Binatus sp. TaxID=2811406 RepID=UPI00271BE747|nr:TolC family protein [Candidatus Binatus sp.]MDO8433231.1 TolC family protein [Candidatus Binatus sp.]